MNHLLRWKNYSLDLSKRTHIMGILNVTPDSFFDGGKYIEKEKAIEHGIKMAEEGADIIDVGGESTRPYSKRISPEEEMERVIPVIEGLAKEIKLPISIDTYKSKVADEALRAGASIINDISAFRFDPKMPITAAKAKVPIILMHMKGRPENMQNNPIYSDLISEIISFLRDAKRMAITYGIKKEFIIVDPGIGFGKTVEHNLTIIRSLSRFSVLDSPVLIGLSNKAFIGHILGKGHEQRETGTMAAIACAIMNGAHIVRVHNVKKAVETARIVDAIKRGRHDTLH